MLITDKNEIVRLKLTHNLPEKVIEFAICDQYPGYKIEDSQINIFALIDNHLVFGVHEMSIICIEYNGEIIESKIICIEYNGEIIESNRSKTLSGYTNNVYSGSEKVILEHWKTMFISRYLNVDN